MNSENEKLRALLKRLYPSVSISDQVRIDEALSQRAEPAPAQSYKDDPRMPAELSLAGCRCVRFGEGNPHWPCRIHTAPAQDELLIKLADFARFVIKCVRRNGEYAPASMQEPHEIETLLAAAFADRPAQIDQWISVEERLPEQFEYVVAARMYGHGIEADMYVSMFVSGRFTVCDDALDASNYDGGACITAKIEVTHWLPLRLPHNPTNMQY